MSVFYVYEHWRPDKDECFYVGKGSRYRSRFVAGRKNVHHQNVVEFLARMGLEVDIRIIASGLTEDAAFSFERERIAYWRAFGVKLANRTDGGEGFCGGRHSDAYRKRVGDMWRGKPRDPEIAKKISSKLKGRVFSPETIEKMRAGQKRRHAANPDHLKNISKLGTLAQYGAAQ